MITLEQSLAEAGCGDLSWMCCVPLELWEEFVQRVGHLTPKQRAVLNKIVCCQVEAKKGNGNGNGNGGISPGGGDREKCLTKLRAATCNTSGIGVLKAVYTAMGGSYTDWLPSIPGQTAFNRALELKQAVGAIVAACETGSSPTDTQLTRLCMAWANVKADLPSLPAGNLIDQLFTNSALHQALLECCGSLIIQPQPAGQFTAGGGGGGPGDLGIGGTVGYGPAGSSAGYGQPSSKVDLNDMFGPGSQAQPQPQAQEPGWTDAALSAGGFAAGTAVCGPACGAAGAYLAPIVGGWLGL